MRGVAEEAPGAYKDVTAVVTGGRTGRSGPPRGAPAAADLHQGVN